MDDFVEKHNLTGAHPFLNDVIVGGRTKDEHERNLKKVLDAVKADQLINTELQKVLLLTAHCCHAGAYYLGGKETA